MKISIGMVFVCGAAFGAAPVTYERFGAKGDGRTDDRAAVIAAHAAANASGAPVRARDGATYYIAGDEGVAVVKTDVDFGTAKFVIDDRKVQKINSPLFRIDPTDAPFEVKGIGPLAKGGRDLGVKLPGKCLVHVADDSVKRYIRFGPNRNSGTAQQEDVLVSKDGKIDPKTPLIWDYARVTRATAYPVDAKTLTVRGGVFVTIANQAESKYRYHNRGFIVNRSNVIVEKMRHEVEGELDHGAPYGGFLSISKCADVTVRDCVFTAHRTYMTIGSGNVPVPMGSYDLSVNNAVNVTFLRSRQTTDIRDSKYWGIFGSNYCKNIEFDGCEFSRFDAHMGVANAAIRNSKLGYMGVHAIGCGTFLVEKSTVYSSYFVELRPDYGSTWDGDFVIRDCTFVPNAGKPGTVFVGSNDGSHDFGYPCAMPRRIVVDGLYVDDSAHPEKYSGPFLFAAFDWKRKTPEPTGSFPYSLAETVGLRNIRTASGKPLQTSPNAGLFRDVKFVRK